MVWASVSSALCSYILKWAPPRTADYDMGNLVMCYPVRIYPPHLWHSLWGNSDPPITVRSSLLPFIVASAHADPFRFLSVFSLYLRAYINHDDDYVWLGYLVSCVSPPLAVPRTPLSRPALNGTFSFPEYSAISPVTRIILPQEFHLISQMRTICWCYNFVFQQLPVHILRPRIHSKEVSLSSRHAGFWIVSYSGALGTCHSHGST